MAGSNDQRDPVSPPEAVQQRMISSFLDIAEGQTSDTARRFLEAARWKVEEAIERFYTGNEYEGAGHQASSSSSSQPPRRLETDAVANLRHFSVGQEEDDDDDGDDDDMVDYEDSSYQEYDLPEETENDAENDSSHSINRPAGQNLDTLFSAPFDLMFRGPFEEAKNAAKLQNKWLLVNLQSSGEFSSHLLNRDTWTDKAVVEIIKENFIFWQEDDRSEEGSKFFTYYKLELLPVIMVIEPLTGLKIRTLIGMVQPGHLLDDLLNCMDSNPIDYCINLSHNDHGDEESDEDMLRSLSLSREGVKLDDGIMEPAFPPLPEEPKVDDPKLLCRVGVRLPDGRRIQRSFLRSDPIQLLWSFCCSELEEAKKRPFRVAFGSPGWFQCLNYSSNLTFEESGLANCMLSFTWD